MLLPRELPVMTLPRSILFPHSMLPLFIFEDRYRRMLKDCLEGDRMFALAMQKPGVTREIPCPVAGVGLIRVCVDNSDGTSHLILEGIGRVKLDKVLAYKPYRRQRVKPLSTTGSDSLAVDALAAKLLELVNERIQSGGDLPSHAKEQYGPLFEGGMDDGSGASLKDALQTLADLDDPEHLADIVSSILLPRPIDRQTILETNNLENRLKRLVQFMIKQRLNHPRKGKGNG